MNVELEYNYQEALIRQGHKQSDVDSIRSIVQTYPQVPKAITDKQVS